MTTMSATMEHWRESVDEARTLILSLSSIFQSSPKPSSSSFFLSSFADHDDPAKSLLTSKEAYSLIASCLSSSVSGASSDPFCHWLYDTYISSILSLRLFSLSFLPIISNLYLSRFATDLPSPITPSAGFEAILLAFYNSQIQSQNYESRSISLPDLTKPSIYHSPSELKFNQSVRLDKIVEENMSPDTSTSSRSSLGVKSLEPQITIKSTQRPLIVGLAFDCYHQHIAEIPVWSKIDFCEVVAAWAGQCNCSKGNENDNRCESENIVKEMRRLEIGKGGSNLECEKGVKILLPWELLQPILKILGHCLMGPFCPEEVKSSASVAVRRIYARVSHDLNPQAILATRCLIQLDNRARDKAAQKAAAAARIHSGYMVQCTLHLYTFHLKPTGVTSLGRVRFKQSYLTISSL
ncbi:hypothetical protein SLEP1_g13982 [Rubroshorea leprosula]|uniref:Hyccin n=1 Tax=Rubroshorea leprosula TaxID=152421 RepID=A0AAV5IHJ9_9ROSI|nr:hypothetical protein SLEP1_g13982 [Rubroshorea leprosula]